MTGLAHRRLREATHADHQQLEARLDLPARLDRIHERRAVVEGFHALHSGIEAAISPWLAHLPGLEFEARRRTLRLERDLRDLDAAPRAPPSAIRVGSVGEALGLLYVLEGSALGGRVIRRQVQARGGDLTGLGFLDPYGVRLGDRWRGFLAVLAAQVTTSTDLDAAVGGARSGFRQAAACLCGALSDV